jgi:aspartyl-tRNA(Asn)/glutamyl-tRNA(Gln) amidotransferase subunit C
MDLDVEYLAKLARIELTPAEEEKFTKDLGKLFDHFKELQSVNTDNVKPMTGGTELNNIFRSDNESLKSKEERDNERVNIIKSFPDKKDEFLKVPQVFE